jgi:hypothetical protein
LDSLIIGRNELAKWHKRNLSSSSNALPKFKQPVEKKQGSSFADFGALTPVEDLGNSQDEDEPLLVHYPPLITRTSECKFCFQRNVCSLTALSIEDVHPQGPRRKGPQGQFPAFLEMQASLTEEVKAYFKRYVECINLEQNAETERFSSSS